ncbi:hypothetical protein MAR_021507 [Mya arenaria]|uniref:Ig-like domain-containing protein n=1 Tax=Mya arenaria TaxID=6604 RepID=A0ABY7E7W0_MYAAR|nr:hypothetical protein MAR_021507 [Mya arenaria]
MFNRFIPSLLQFVEGLKLDGMLDMLRKCPEKAYSYHMQTEHVDSLTIKVFFKPVFSSDKAGKEDEEVILCNFHQFLKKLERGKISCISIDAETGSSSEVNLNTGHLLQALIRCPALPSCITEGIITFDHKSDYLTTVNTCAPSVNFSKLSVIKNYSSFEELMKNVIVGSYGFGRVTMTHLPVNFVQYLKDPGPGYSTPTQPILSASGSSFVNSKLTLTCTSSSTTQPSNHSLTMQYAWTIDGTVIQPGGRFSFDAISRKTLAISELLNEDNGDTVYDVSN